jgi:hypothetical protein
MHDVVSNEHVIRIHTYMHGCMYVIRLLLARVASTLVLILARVVLFILYSSIIMHKMHDIISLYLYSRVRTLSYLIPQEYYF